MQLTKNRYTFLLDRGYTLMSREDAVKLAGLSNADHEDDWSYKAIHDPSGKGLSYVAVYDELGYHVGNL